VKYHELQITSKKSIKRVGRGISAGGGKTAGRGTKGQNARTGGGVRPGFEGGQNPLMQRIPKLPGFRSHIVKAELVYTGELDQFAGKTVDTAILSEAGIVSNPYVRVKLVVKGNVTKKVTVKLPGASAPAIKAVTAAGGSFTAVPQLGRVAKEKSEEK
jgi:large subunit ribosomal protein L15